MVSPMQKTNFEDLQAVYLATGMGLHYRLMNWRVAGMTDVQEFYAIVDEAIDSCVSSMAKYPKELSTMKEDQLSVFMIQKLEGIGLDASHDSTVGGHCDIVIKGGSGLLWLGEAKLVSGKHNAHIEGGYLQLVSRYATALPGQDRGALIVFCNCERIDQVLESWLEHVTDRRSQLKLLNHDKDKIELLSSEIHAKNGRTFVVRHKPISVYWSPESKEKA